MKLLFFLSLAAFIVFISCGKKYTTKPQISLESITTVIAFDGTMDAKLKFTDKQGDLGGGTFIAIRKRLNQFPLPSGDSLVDMYLDTIPSFPNYSNGEFEYTLPANFFQEYQFQNDTLIMKFAVVDRAGNKSDTISSPVIVALYQ
jgi:hypothetical protein